MCHFAARFKSKSNASVVMMDYKIFIEQPPKEEELPVVPSPLHQDYVG